MAGWFVGPLADAPVISGKGLNQTTAPATVEDLGTSEAMVASLLISEDNV